MKVGLRAPMFGWRATRDHIEAHARAAEAHGFDSLWVSDHVVMPRQHDSEHRAPFKVEEAFLEPLTTMAFLAAVTERVELGVSVLVDSFALERQHAGSRVALRERRRDVHAERFGHDPRQP